MKSKVIKPSQRKFSEPLTPPPPPVPASTELKTIPGTPIVINGNEQISLGQCLWSVKDGRKIVVDIVMSGADLRTDFDLRPIMAFVRSVKPSSVIDKP